MQIPDEHPFNPLQAILQQLVGRELPSLASRKAAKSSSEPAEKPKKEGFQAPYFFNEKYVQLLKAKAENKDIQDLLKWMGRFEKGLLDAVIASAPKAAGLFYELMIQERDKRTVPAETVRKVVLQFQRHCIFTHMKPHDDFTIKCPDGDVPINLTLMALFADFFQRLQSAGMKELKEDGRVVQFVHSRGAVENLKKYVQGGAKSLSDSDFDGLVELAMLANYVAFPELTQACIDELKKKIKTTDIPNENKLEIMLAQLEQLGAVTAEYHSLKIDAIARFCKAEIPHKESSDKKGCLIPLDALGLMQGDGVVANGLRSAVRGFEVSETSDSERVAERVADLEFMEEEDRARVFEIRLHHTCKDGRELIKLISDKKFDAALALFPRLLVIGMSTHPLNTIGPTIGHLSAENFVLGAKIVEKLPCSQTIQLVRIYPNSRELTYPQTFEITEEVMDALQSGPQRLYDMPTSLKIGTKGSFFANCNQNIETIKARLESVRGLRPYRCGAVETKSGIITIQLERREDIELLPDSAATQDKANSHASSSSRSSTNSK